jgi:predicted TIM-barrel fold metal-dependent hydrolase
MKIIDAHNHLFREKRYEVNLLKTMDEWDIEKCCISGLGRLFYCWGNLYTQKVIKTHPDRFIGAYYFRPGISDLIEIEEAYSRGFKMLKVTIPKKPYDAEDYFPIWETAEKLNMPILFHTGLVTFLGEGRGEHINSWFMHPMRLEPIANEFSDLNIIIAHLGVHWNRDAAEVARMKPKVFVDLTGDLDGWRVRADREGMNTYLWWDGAWDKVIFGTDVHYTKIGKLLEQDKHRVEIFNVSTETQNLIFSGNISKMLGI